jgi:hypothetical protein
MTLALTRKTLTAEIIKHAGENQGLQDFRGPNFSSQPDVCGLLAKDHPG